jgi:hypothetical protein
VLQRDVERRAVVYATLIRVRTEGEQETEDIVKVSTPHGPCHVRRTTQGSNQRWKSIDRWIWIRTQVKEFLRRSDSNGMDDAFVALPHGKVVSAGFTVGVASVYSIQPSIISFSLALPQRTLIFGSGFPTLLMELSNFASTSMRVPLGRYTGSSSRYVNCQLN